MSTIRSLCPEVKEKLQSGVAISGMAQCVEELILNSLDSGATFIEIAVEPSSWKIRVADDGNGMSLEDMRIVGERHNTSKCHSVADLRNPKTFGYRGQALASIRDVCLRLEIESRLRLSPHSHIKTFTKGVVPWALERLKSTRQRPGTTVTVTDLFHSVPVRKNFASTETEFDMVRRLVESVALIHSGVSFVLVNSETNCRVLETFGKGSLVAAFDCLFGNSKAFGLKPFEFETSVAKFSGYIGTKGGSRKTFQFIYVNGRWMQKTGLHKVLHQMLKLSVLINSDQSHRGSSYLSTDLHGVYIINISCVVSWTDVSLLKSRSFLESGDFQDLADHLKRGLLEFLSRENLLDSLSTACLLHSEPREDLAGSQNKGGGKGERQSSSKVITGIDYEDNNHSISTGNIKNNQQSKLIHRFGRVTRKSPKKRCQTPLPVISSSDGEQMQKLETLGTGDHPAESAEDRNVTGKEFSQIQEKKCFGYEFDSKSFDSKSFDSKSFDSKSFDTDIVPEHTSLGHYIVQPQIQKQEMESLLSEHLDLEETPSLTAENVLGVDFDVDTSGKATGRFTNDIERKRTDSYFFKKQETFTKFLGHSMITGSAKSNAMDCQSSGNSCQVRKRMFPFAENAANDSSRMEDGAGLWKDNTKGGDITKRMSLELTEGTDERDALILSDSELPDNNKMPQGGKVQSCCVVDRFRNGHQLKDWMGSGMQVLRRGKVAMASEENLAASADLCVVDTSKVEGLLGMRLSSFVAIEHTSVSYYYSDSDGSLGRKEALLPEGWMEVRRENSFTQIRSMSSASERLEQRQLLRLRKHSDLQLDSLSFGRPVCIHDWKQKGNTLQDVIDLRRSGNELNILDSQQLTNSSISNLKVICQVDRKFIAGWIKKSTKPGSNTESEVLVFVDQHAADERVRLERLSKETVELDNRGTSRIKSSVLHPVLMLGLDIDVIRVMDKFQEFFASIGLTYSIDRQQTTTGRLWLRTVPSCFLMHSAASSSTTSRNAIKYLAQKLIHELIQEIEETNLVHPTSALLPKLLHNILCSQACHGAIKFGDALGREDCETLVGRLALCRLPFQCAHGRPTMVPIADLTHIRRSFPLKKPTRPRLWRLKGRAVSE